MDDETVGIFSGIFQAIDQLRYLQRLRSYTTLAFAEMRYPNGEETVIGSMNGSGGLVSAAYRAAMPEVEYFAVNSSIADGSVISLQQNVSIVRANNRHAEMNLVMFALAQHLRAGRTLPQFSLDAMLLSINPSQGFCPECQLALALLSAGGARLVASISDHVMAGKVATLALRGSGNLSPNWAQPWASYYNDVPGSDFLRPNGQPRPGGPYLITVQGAQVVIYRGGPGHWVVAQQIPVHHA